MSLALRLALPALVAGGLLACADGTGSNGTPRVTTSYPTPGSVNVDPAVALSFEFSHALAPSMAEAMTLHQGPVAGASVPMTCGWSNGNETLTCRPDAPLDRGTMYTVHAGAAMMDPGNMGGKTGGGMMTGDMGGMAGPMMPEGWHHSSDHDGMTYSFTTAP